MDTYNAADDAAGEGLAAMAEKSGDVVRRIAGAYYAPAVPGDVPSLRRVVVHADPHLDEYFAELVFRAWLPRDRRDCAFVEQSVFSPTDDPACRDLWPSAAVFGIGGTAGGGATPLFLFDEHLGGRARAAPSCSQLVVDRVCGRVPPAVATLLREVNAIDEYGGAHAQHLGQLAKGLHEVRVGFGGDVGGDSGEALSPDAKRAVIDGCLAAVLACLDAGVDLESNPAEKQQSMARALDAYVQHSAQAGHPRFRDAAQRMRSQFGDQTKVFQDAVLRDHGGPIRTEAGALVPQLLLLSRVCFACEHVWGAPWRDLIAAHVFESEVQRQLHFYAVDAALRGAFTTGAPHEEAVTSVGTFTRVVLPDVMADAAAGGRGARDVQGSYPVWVLAGTPRPGILQANGALSNFLNRANGGCGVILVRHPVTATSALIKGRAFPDASWRRLVDAILEREGSADVASPPFGCWHVTANAQGGIAPFLLNGNAAHRYVPPTALDAETLAALVRRTF